MKKVVSELKRTLSLVLAFMMVATSVPQAAMNVLAEEADAVITVAVDENAEAAGFEEVVVDAETISANSVDEYGIGKYTVSANSISTNDITLTVYYENTEDYTVSAKTKKGDAVEEVDGQIVIAAGTYEADDEITICFTKVEKPTPEPINPFVVSYANTRVYLGGGKVTVKAPKVTYEGAKAKATFKISENKVNGADVAIDPSTGKLTISGKVSKDADLKVTATLEGNVEVVRDVYFKLTSTPLANLASDAVLVKINSHYDEDLGYSVIDGYSKVSQNSISINTTEYYAVKVLTTAAKDKTEYTYEDFVASNAYTVKMPSKKVVEGSANYFRFVGANRKAKFTVKANDKDSKGKWGSPKQNGTYVIEKEVHFKEAPLDKLVLNLEASTLERYENEDGEVFTAMSTVSENSISANKACSLNAPITALVNARLTIDGESASNEYSLKVTYKNANVLKNLTNYVSYKAKKKEVVVTVKDNANKKAKAVTFTITTDDASISGAKSGIKLAKGQKALDANVAISGNTIKLDNLGDAKKIIIGADPVSYAKAWKKAPNNYEAVINSISSNVIDVKSGVAEIKVIDGSVLPAGTYQFYAIPADQNGKAIGAASKIKIAAKAVKVVKLNATVKGTVKISSNSISGNSADGKMTFKKGKLTISNNSIVVANSAAMSNAVVNVKGKGKLVNDFTEAYDVKLEPNNNKIVVTVKNPEYAKLDQNHVGFVTFKIKTGYNADYGFVGAEKLIKVKIVVK